MNLITDALLIVCLLGAGYIALVAVAILHRHKTVERVKERIVPKTDWVAAAHSAPPQSITYELVPCTRPPILGEMRYRKEAFGNLETVIYWPHPIVWTGKEWSPI